MADNKQEPQFLGGGPKFNRAGAQPPDTEPTHTRHVAGLSVAQSPHRPGGDLTDRPALLDHDGAERVDSCRRPRRHIPQCPPDAAGQRRAPRPPVEPAARAPSPPLRGPKAGGETDRVRCAYCGANNFPASPPAGSAAGPCSLSGPAGRPRRHRLAPAAPGPPRPRASRVSATPDSGVQSGGGAGPAVPLGGPAHRHGLPDAGRPAQGPARLDRHRLERGGTVLNLLLFLLPLATLWPLVKSLSPHRRGRRRRSARPAGTGGGDAILPAAFLFAVAAALMFHSGSTR